MEQPRQEKHSNHDQQEASVSSSCSMTTTTPATNYHACSDNSHQSMLSKALSQGSGSSPMANIDDLMVKTSSTIIDQQQSVQILSGKPANNPINIPSSSSSSCPLDSDTTSLSLSPSFSSPSSSFNHNRSLPASLSITPSSMPNSSVPSDGSSVTRDELTSSLPLQSPSFILSPSSQTNSTPLSQQQQESTNIPPTITTNNKSQLPSEQQQQQRTTSNISNISSNNRESLLASQVHEEEEESSIFQQPIIVHNNSSIPALSNQDNFSSLEENIKKYYQKVKEDEEVIVETKDVPPETVINVNYFIPNAKKKKDSANKNIDTIKQVLPQVADNIPSWVSELRRDWDEEITTNMDESKRQYFLKFSEDDTEESDEEESDENGLSAKKNVKIRKHMRQFIQEKEEDNSSKKYFLGASSEPNTPQKSTTNREKSSPPVSIKKNNKALSKPSEGVISESFNQSRFLDSTINTEFESFDKKAYVDPNTSTTSFIFRENAQKIVIPPIIAQPLLQEKEPSSPTRQKRHTFITNNSELKHFQPKKENLFKKLFTSAPKKRSEEDWRDELIKYDQRLSNYLKESRQVVKDLRKRQEIEYEKMQQEYAFLQRCHDSKLIEIFKELSSCKLIRLKQRRELEKGCKTLIKDRIKIIREILVQQAQQLKQVEQAGDINMKCYNLLPHYVKNESFYKDVEDILSDHESLSSQWNEIILLEQISKDLSERYTQMKKDSNINKKVITKKEVTIRLKSIIQRFIEEPVVPLCNFHSLNEGNSMQKDVHLDDQTWQSFINCVENDQRLEIEQEFFDLIADQRTEEGQSLRTFLKEINNAGLEKVPPAEIAEYVVIYVDYLSDRHAIKTDLEKQAILRLVSRLIYNEFGLGLRLQKIEIESQSQENYKFQQQVRLLRKLTANQLGVANKFLPIRAKFTGKQNSIKEMIHKQNQTPFYDPIATLGYLNYCVSPIDMLHCVYSCARQIHIIAKDNCSQRGKDFSFGADEFFPILVYVVVHAHLPNIHSALSYISKYSSQSRNSEVVYYLTCLEGAVMYAQELSEEDIQELVKQDDQDQDKPNEKEPLLTTSIETTKEANANSYDSNNFASSASVESTTLSLSEGSIP
ncbi:vacuolar sorting protein 9 domain-containing protein [Naegleria gruberi]|uniref:Vacuolar sorting protein 9 domain-containing protein n=1 Tax=Naegleria gruberi TaxID=5762 RepID=D2VPA9_NAEGR|nr:vacuolar sorting protein 9 domain-containing protein [Naegleria gruberi]EFC41400.1 vacuolar sorting protein 9 domain-containing protein [Naegleria gruberi]|eukprot:XP_002674144.1 vacuolar sorting protein 9 domain-containing protein [Naegleria gruberi strain NEG-M]